jgi:beta-N-acetylhexosaminidase
VPFRTAPAVVAGLLLLGSIGGCAAPAAPDPAPTGTPSATPEPRAFAANDDPERQFVIERLASMSVREEAASVLMLHLGGTDAGALDDFLAGQGLGGVILMGDNVPQPDSALRDLTDALAEDRQLPPLIAIDQEGGIVRRVLSDSGPAASRLRSRPPAETRDAFVDRSALLERLGVNVNFGIIADATGEPGSFIRSRTLGDTPAEAAPRVAAAVEGEQGRVLSTLKHFPGHGVAPGDSHSSIPSTTMKLEDWQHTHALPFQAGIDAGAELVMFGHLQFDAVDPLPASLSARWHDILRDDLGFAGVAVTDDLTMLESSGRPELSDPVENAVSALEAGNDLLLFVGPVDVGNVTDAIVAAVESGRIPRARLDEAARRVLELRHSLAH